ncbi:MAG TPA: hypothetical protein VMR62_20095 [Bryobacteraceae bacterium]|jgi:hypothetical protein|nr:hypothetical protein [Bryobacteraceae bacterium]
MAGFGAEQKYIGALLAAYPARIKDADEFAPPPRRSAFKELVVSRATLFSFGPEIEIRMCSAEDLIVLKLFASRPLDIRDAGSVAVRK